MLRIVIIHKCLTWIQLLHISVTFRCGKAKKAKRDHQKNQLPVYITYKNSIRFAIACTYEYINCCNRRKTDKIQFLPWHHKIPNYKHQITNKFQILIQKKSTRCCPATTRVAASLHTSVYLGAQGYIAACLMYPPLTGLNPIIWC